MLDWLVADAELAKVVSHHLRLDLHLVELFATVDADHRPNHLWHDDHVTQMRLDKVGLLVRFRRLLGLSEFLDQAHGSALKATVEAAAGAGVEQSKE
jgi:hypothetical protein